MSSHKVLVVANRLPFKVTRKEDSWTFGTSDGGLVSALSGLKEVNSTWIAWAGVDVPDVQGQKTLTEALAKKGCVPVFLDKEMICGYYDGFCNTTLWPLLHYQGLPDLKTSTEARRFELEYNVYEEVNKIFAEVVNQHYKEGDVVWCQDYHLMFLPKLLKDKNKEMTVGWFLHTTFPSVEAYRELPWRSQLLEGVLSADLIGFHIQEYAEYFKSACIRFVPGCKGECEGVRDKRGRLTTVFDCPIGINPNRFLDALETDEIKELIAEVKKEARGRKIILGIDRLDPIKGIPEKLLAYEKFLVDNPQWLGEVVFYQLVVPSRIESPLYKKLLKRIRTINGEIVEKHQTIFTCQPLTVRCNTLKFPNMCAMLAEADVALVTSFRDGMNLVSYEYVACQAARKGVLVLSEFAGAAESLHGALVVNPHSVTEVASAIARALSMSQEEKATRHEQSFAHVTQHTSSVWAENFIRRMINIKKNKNTKKMTRIRRWRKQLVRARIQFLKARLRICKSSSLIWRSSLLRTRLCRLQTLGKKKQLTGC